jgi:hypothetical protein
MNPTVTDVITAFNRIPEKGAVSIAIDRAGVVLPKGGHFQGIQRLPGEPQLLVITSSSLDTQGYFVVCDMAENGLSGRARSPVTMARSPFIHAGGCQAVGHFLVAGVENPEFNRTSEVQFWDFRRFPVQLISMTIPRSGAENVSTAGAVGMSSLGDGSVLAVATFNAGTVDFYMSVGNPFSGSPFGLKFTWALKGADMANWIDQNWAHYQSVNLITQTTGELFMVAFHRDDQARDWMDLYSVDLAGGQSALKKMAKKHMTCTNGCNFNAGAGIFIPSTDGIAVSQSFEVFAVSYYSGDNVTGTTINVNHFTAI